MLERFERVSDKIIDFFGVILAILLLLLIVNVAYDVFARYVLHIKTVATQELEWHNFAIIMLYGTGYALRHNAHVRVDFIYDKLSSKKQALINIFGAIFFIIPLALIVIYSSYEFVMDSYTTNEVSPDPGGLPYRWIIKAQIPFAFIFLLFCTLNFIVKNINIYRGKEAPLKEEEVEV